MLDPDTCPNKGSTRVTQGLINVNNIYYPNESTLCDLPIKDSFNINDLSARRDFWRYVIVPEILDTDESLLTAGACHHNLGLPIGRLHVDGDLLKPSTVLFKHNRVVRRLLMDSSLNSFVPYCYTRNKNNSKETKHTDDDKQNIVEDSVLSVKEVERICYVQSFALLLNENILSVEWLKLKLQEIRNKIRFPNLQIKNSAELLLVYKYPKTFQDEIAELRRAILIDRQRDGHKHNGAIISNDAIKNNDLSLFPDDWSDDNMTSSPVINFQLGLKPLNEIVSRIVNLFETHSKFWIEDILIDLKRDIVNLSDFYENLTSSTEDGSELVLKMFSRRKIVPKKKQTKRRRKEDEEPEKREYLSDWHILIVYRVIQARLFLARHLKSKQSNVFTIDRFGDDNYLKEHLKYLNSLIVLLRQKDSEFVQLLSEKNLFVCPTGYNEEVGLNAVDSIRFQFWKAYLTDILQSACYEENLYDLRSMAQEFHPLNWRASSEKEEVSNNISQNTNALLSPERQDEVEFYQRQFYFLSLQLTDHIMCCVRESYRLKGVTVMPVSQEKLWCKRLGCFFVTIPSAMSYLSLPTYGVLTVKCLPEFFDALREGLDLAGGNSQLSAEIPMFESLWDGNLSFPVSVDNSLNSKTKTSSSSGWRSSDGGFNTSDPDQKHYEVKFLEPISAHMAGVFFLIAIKSARDIFFKGNNNNSLSKDYVIDKAKVLSRTLSTNIIFKLKLMQQQNSSDNSIDNINGGYSVFKPNLLKMMIEREIQCLDQLHSSKTLISRFIRTKSLWMKAANVLLNDLMKENEIAHENNYSMLLENRDDDCSIDFPSSNLNKVQKDCVLSALLRPVTIIQGPPGTGKTITSAIIVMNWLNNFEKYGKIIVTCQSNRAVENIYNKIYDCLIQCRMDPDAILQKSSASEYRELNSSEERAEYKMSKISARILVSTSSHSFLYSWFNRKLGSRSQIASLIVDEAAQLQETSLLIPLVSIYDVQRMVLVGDPYQLGPQLDCEPIISRGHYAKDVFPGLNISMMERLFASVSGKAEACLMLNKQHRMHPSIAHWPYQIFYSGNVTTPDWVTEKLKRKDISRLLRFRNKMFRVGVINCSSPGACQKSGWSFLNELEARIALKICNSILERDPSYTIGIITPYAAQEETILSLLDEEGYCYPEDVVLIGNIDKIQGEERDVVILSMVRSETHTLGFNNSPNRMNVALTRSKQALILLCDVELFSSARYENCEKDNNVNALWNLYLKWAKDNNLIFKSSDVDRFLRGMKENEVDYNWDSNKVVDCSEMFTLNPWKKEQNVSYYDHYIENK